MAYVIVYSFLRLLLQLLLLLAIAIAAAFAAVYMTVSSRGLEGWKADLKARHAASISSSVLLVLVDLHSDIHIRAMKPENLLVFFQKHFLC